MYRKAYGVIEALSPVHVGATAGEETGHLNTRPDGFGQVWGDR